MIAVLCIIIALLVAALVGVILIWHRAYTLLARYDAIDNVDTFRESCEKESKRLHGESKQLKDKIRQRKSQLKQYMEVTGVIKSASEAKQKLDEFNSQLESVRREIATVEETADLQQVGFYKRQYDYDTPSAYKDALEEVVSEQKAMIKNREACVCHTEWQAEGSASKGKKMVSEQIRLMLRAFNGECDAAIGKVRYNNITTIEKRFNKCFDALNKMAWTW